jgi:hypothetical protein
VSAHSIKDKMGEDKFLDELEKRLEENRRIVAQGWLPKPIQGLASYLGFHQFRTLVIISLVMTAMSFGFFYDPLIKVSKLLFLFK